MIKIFISLIILNSLVLAFSFSSITDSISTVATSTKSLFISDKNASKTDVDLECVNPLDNYENNYREALKIAGMYTVANSSSVLNFLSNKQSSNNDIENTSSAIKKLSSELAKKTVWIPVEVEEYYGEQIYNDRLKNNDIILKTTKNKKYKTMYKKWDIFVDSYNKYLEENKYLENNKYPFKIKIFILSSKKKAEAIPGGYLFISEDFIKDNRYATILTHELTHVSKRHLTKDLQYRLISGYDNVSDIIQFIKDMQSKNFKEKVDMTSSKDMLKLRKDFQKHSQSQELEADACSLRILTTINEKNKQIYINELIKNIDMTMQDTDENASFSFSISEHPNKEKRISNINKLSKKI